MKHTRKRTLAANIMAAFSPAELSTFPGRHVFTKSARSKKSRRHSIRRWPRILFPQRYLDYYGMVIDHRVDEWEVFRNPAYVGQICEYGSNFTHVWKLYSKKVRTMERQRRKFRKIIKKLNLENRLNITS